MQPLVNVNNIHVISWCALVCIILMWSIRNKMRPDSKGHFGFLMFCSIFVFCLFVTVYFEYIIWIIPFLFAFFSSDHYINKSLELLSSDSAVQISIAKRLAEWFEKMSAAVFVGCFIGVITSMPLSVAHPSNINNKLNNVQISFILFGVLTISTTLFATVKLTSYIAKRSNKKSSTAE